jgi:hypothetical protein
MENKKENDVMKLYDSIMCVFAANCVVFALCAISTNDTSSIIASSISLFCLVSTLIFIINR